MGATWKKLFIFATGSSSSSSNLTSIYHRQTVSETPPRPGTSNNSTSSSGCKYKDTGEGQNGAGPIIKESMEGDGRLLRKKMSLEKRVEKRIRRSRAKSKRKRIKIGHCRTSHQGCDRRKVGERMEE